MSDRKSEFNLPLDGQSKREVGVKWAYRWEVFRRLQSLGIDCQCSTNEPLLVNLDSPTTLVQIWSVVRQLNVERSQLVDWLDNCWRLQGDRHNRQSF